MTSETVLVAASGNPGGALSLMTVPFAFTQDRLLTTDAFLSQAKDRGARLSAEGLQKLHEAGLLVPMYRIDDEPDAEQRVDVDLATTGSANGSVALAAIEGRLRDAPREGYSSTRPHLRPEAPRQDPPLPWSNGYVYSPWQLLGVHSAVRAYEAMQAGLLTGPDSQAERSRTLVGALVVLSPLYLPGVLGVASLSSGMSGTDLSRFRREADILKLLATATVQSLQLRIEAERLLDEAHFRDPLDGWLPLIRHANHRSWSKLRGDALDCIWLRIGAEVLLRAHEDLAAAGHLEPLPSMKGVMWMASLHGRLGKHSDDADSLDRALGSFGLSPHPRVLLLVEGETELDHVPRLLAEFGIAQPELVRVQQTEGSKVNPQLLVRYSITPRLGERMNGLQRLDRTPTAVMIAMDAEHQWSTQDDRDKVRRILQKAIREEVEFQGGEIHQDDLDFLVDIRAWGDHGMYELGNFTDDELVPAIIQLATSHCHALASDPTWEATIRAELREARLRHYDIKIPLGRLRVRENKTGLARLLWPVLLSKCLAELADGNPTTPVLQLVLDVREKVAKLSATSYVLTNP